MKLLLALFFICHFPIYTGNGYDVELSNVWICTGSNAYSYHCRRGCRGLNKCNDEIKSVTISYAKSIGRKPCKICY